MFGKKKNGNIRSDGACYSSIQKGKERRDGRPKKESEKKKGGASTNTSSTTFILTRAVGKKGRAWGKKLSGKEGRTRQLFMVGGGERTWLKQDCVEKVKMCVMKESW